MAVATAGGMTSSTILTLFVVPAVYSYMDRLGAWITGRGRSEAAGADDSIR